MGTLEVPSPSSHSGQDYLEHQIGADKAFPLSLSKLSPNSHKDGDSSSLMPCPRPAAASWRGLFLMPNLNLLRWSLWPLPVVIWKHTQEFVPLSPL